MSFLTSISDRADGAINLMSRIPSDFVSFTLRLGLAGIFWASARTKVTGLMTISDSTYYLFEEEYQLPILPVDLAAPLTTYAEHILPVFLVIGLAARFSAFGIFLMTLVIQIFVYPAAFWSTHLGWFSMALAVVAVGPGRWSIDYLIARRFRSPLVSEGAK